MHNAGKDYRSISEDLRVHRSRIRSTVYKRRKFPRSRRSAKKKNPRVTGKDLQKTLMDEHHKGSHSCPKKKTQQKTLWHGDVPQQWWEKFCGQMRQKVHFLARMHNAMFGGKQTLHANTKTSLRLWSMVKGASWFRAALLPQDREIIEGTIQNHDVSWENRAWSQA